MSMQLKILDQRHKQKLNLKALDAVLFGPPQRKYTKPFNEFYKSVFVPLKCPSTLQVRSTTG